MASRALQPIPLRALTIVVSLLASLVLLASASCQREYVTRKGVVVVIPPTSVVKPLPANASPQLKQFIDAAIEQSKVTTGYDPS